MFPSYIQSEAKDCGPSCLKIVAKHYGKNCDIEYVRTISETTRGGTSLTSLIKAAESLGFDAVGVKENFNTLKEEIPLPALAHWNQEHFVVIYKITDKYVYISDPELGRVKYKIQTFLEHWLDEESLKGDQEGILLLLCPGENFDELKEEGDFGKQTKDFLKLHLFKYKRSFVKILGLVLLISVLELAFPYITQQIIDKGVQTKDVPFIYLAAVAYIVAFIGYKTANIVRNWIIIKLSMKFNISLISDFIKKLTILPISYYDSKLSGDIFQRISDHDNLEKFFTSNSVVALFSILNILIFSGLFLWYDIDVFLIFAVGTIVHVSWVLLFFNKRKVLDFKYFSIKTKENNKIIELINGMQDIKLNAYDEVKKNEWKKIREQLYKRDMESMKVEQFQLDGASFINEIKNISIIILSSILVVNNNMTFGTLLAVSYVIGHLSSPIEKIVLFLNNIQDVKLGLRRIMEIHNKKNEGDDMMFKKEFSIGDIVLENIDYRYTGTSKNVLNNISFTIPKNKTTAIVGPSGSGKSTILKLLLKFYDYNSGVIRVGDSLIQDFDFEAWRNKCGVVMQEGFIFNDSIENNIVIAQERDQERLEEACRMSNIKSFIEELPLNYATKIGEDGLDLSTGQKQRILMARAIYKNPEFLLFDEATSALDAKNEKQISKNLESFFKDRTVLLIAHRLSTVKNADQIIVLSESGTIVEIGNHTELLQNRGYYHNLVKNQLEMN
ncbi:peptidase domain-containing ABC transporter [Pseudofulvibacter geojedonensis]|uniref:Peptidase domain-containing ABC transporter n=1 Tax=Pseudofulvibacter geojedonensis TaxID=1123758 RepID=A0ABW3I1I6_9FLAO